MNVENETDREVDYEQTGSNGGMEVPAVSPSRGKGESGGNCSGKLPSKAKATFVPCGSAPWTVVFKMNQVVIATSPSISQPNATVRLGVTVI